MIDKNINSYAFISFLFLFLLAQVVFVPQLFHDKIFPDLVLILLISASFLYNSSDIFYVTFFSGLVIDMFSSSNFGSAIISLLFSIFLSSYLSHHFLKKLLSVNLFLISFITIVCYNVLYFTLINVNNFSLVLENLIQLIFTTAAETIYTVLLIFPVTCAISKNANTQIKLNDF